MDERQVGSEAPTESDQSTGGLAEDNDSIGSDSIGSDLQNAKSEFEEAGDEQEMSLVRECWAFIAENKKWWLLPMMIVLGLVSVLILLTSTGAGPFIYALF